MTDANFPNTAAKLKNKYEALSNKVSTINATSPSTTNYPNEKATVEYIEGLKDYIKGT